MVAAFYVGVRYSIERYVYLFCLLFLAVVAGFRPAECCSDFSTYVGYYMDLDKLSLINLEPTFFLIANISRGIFDGPIGIFLIYAFVGVFSKGWAIKRISNFYLLSLIIYSATYFLLHEMTQIRVGIASSILLLSVPAIYERTLLKFLFFVVIGTLFHYSFVLFAFCYFLDPKTIKPGYYILLILFGYVGHFWGVDIISTLKLIPVPFIASKIDAYNTLMKIGNASNINLFSVVVLYRLALLTVLLWKSKILYENNRYAIILVKIYACSMFLFAFFSTLPVLSFRVRELLGIVEVILIPFLIYIIKERHVAFALILLIGLVLMSMDIWYNKIIFSYF